MEEYFIIFHFDEDVNILVKYTCSKDYVSKEDIEDCVCSYCEAIEDENGNVDREYEDIIDDIMISFDGVEYSIINFGYLDLA